MQGMTLPQIADCEPGTMGLAVGTAGEYQLGVSGQLLGQTGS